MLIGTIGRTATAVVALGVFLAVAPVGFGFSMHEGLGLQVGQAFAKDGDHGGGNSGKGGGNGGGGGKGGGNGGGGGKNDDNGGGGGNSGDGNGGGNDDRGGDDDGGRGNEDRDGGRGGDNNGGRGGDDRGGGRGGDDNGGRGGDDRGGDDRTGAVQGGGAVAAPGDGLRVVKIERSANGIEIIYSNRVREEIENGRYELKNAAGRTVVQRAATQSDFDRIGRNVRNSGLTPPQAGNGGTPLPSGSQAGSVEVSGRNIEVRYVTGWKEAIEAGRYELKDPNNNTVVERPATTADRDRMLALAGG